MTIIEHMKAIYSRGGWEARWIKSGMCCVMAGGKSWEAKPTDEIAAPEALGCGGWNAKGELFWVGIDLDVGHGNEKAKYETIEDAIAAGKKIDDFVKGACEIRRSKSGNGIHVRVAVDSVKEDGRVKARLITKYIVRMLGIRADPSVLGRQNLWFWSAQVNEHSFELVSECLETWTLPADALIEYVPPYIPPPRETGVSAVDRANAYMEKVDPAISGSGGHNQCFHAACVLILGFGLTIAEARPILQNYSARCDPPWTEAEIEHKLRDADRQPGPRGLILNANRKVDAPLKVAETVEKSPSDLVREQCIDEIERRRFAVSWPWDKLTKLTYALLPQTVTVLCGPPGTSKSFMVVESLEHWLDQGVSVAILMLEENQTFHTRRALSQFIGNSNIVDYEWVRDHPDAAAEILDKPENVAFMDKLGRSIHIIQGQVDTDSVLAWMTAMFAAGHRVIVIDPITARDGTQHAWLDDQKFVRVAKGLVDSSDSSLVLVTHPPKGATQKQQATTDLSDIAGGAAFGRFTSTVMWLAFVEEKEVKVVTLCGTTHMLVNRRMELRKTRNKHGQGKRIGMYFDPKSLGFIERGILCKEEKA